MSQICDQGGLIRIMSDLWTGGTDLWHDPNQSPWSQICDMILTNPTGHRSDMILTNPPLSQIWHDPSW
jgi:16S rRNA G1207 methylase RsmC